MLNGTTKQTRLTFLFFCALVNFCPLQAEPVYLSEASLFYREGFTEEAPNTIWTEVDSKKINFGENKTLSIPDGLGIFLNSLFVKEDVVREFSIQIQFRSDGMDHFTTPGLKILQIGESWDLYQNGELIYASKLGTSKKLRPFLTSLHPNKMINQGSREKIILTLHVKGREHSPNFALVLSSSDKIDELANLQKESIEIFPFFACGVFFVLGLYLTYLYLRVKRLKAVLYFGLFQFSYAMAVFSLSNFAMQTFGDSNLLQIIETNAIYSAFLFIVCFHDVFLLNKIQRISKITIFVGILCMFVNTIFYSYFPNIISLLTIIETPMLFFYLFIFYKILIKRHSINRRLENPIPFYLVYLRNRAGILSIIIVTVASAIYFETVLEWKFNLKTPLVFAASLFYSVFMAMNVIRRLEEGLVQKATFLYARDHDRKQFELEKQLTIQRERELTFNDIHDETSADLTFVKLKIEKFADEGSLPKYKADEILTLISRISTGIRQRLHSFDDERNMIDHFADGITLLLLRKYESTGKIVNIETEKIDHLTIHLSNKKIENLCKILREIANNDTKYGESVSTWFFSIHESELLMELQSLSTFHKKANLPGLGSKNISNLAKEIGVQVQETMDGFNYKIQLRLHLT
ncbi:hypothetical protein EHQ58_09095 [Leptospira ognonensis]|uniref:7TM-DISM receptor extracellular domain-containing protein n=1 Tax=Leptospira ognonensis TaxID=2484945 RepID=A0A4R9K4Y2_9LEPT|nr:7TM diverse intracellular signaling domain-containing protein [Leptospira ognonensis]TGL59388.1 hypothetical protein EHQ58_09095 [Leptospira ognonensis]